MKRYTPISGLILVIAGGISYAIKGAMEIYIAGLLWVGLILLLLSFYINFSDIRTFLSKRSTRYGANTAIMVTVFLGVVTLVTLMSIRYKMRWDLTETKRYTLSDQTQKLIKSLKKDVEVIAFYRSEERTKQAMEDLLQEYSHLSPRFTYQFIDPDRRPGMAQKYGITSYRTTIIKSGNRQEIIGFENEEKMTNAILKVTRDEVKNIYLLKGHGENSITDFQNTGYKAVKEAIEKENYSVKELLLLGAEEVPKDASLLIVSGPKKDILPEELTKVEAYIGRSGKVLFMLDPGSAPTLVAFLKKYGFSIGDDMIIDKLSQVFGANYLTPVVAEYDKEHPVTRDFDIATFFPVARSVEVERNPQKGIYALARTGPASWGETDLKALEDGRAEYQEGKDRKGPVTIVAVAAVETEEGQEASSRQEGKDKQKDFARIVVAGDSDFVNNTHINLAGNKDLFLNIINWLAEEADLISIRKKEADATPVILTQTQGRLIFWLPVIILPSLVIVTGIGVMLRRRS
ncbi:MAG: GldG family protein [Deltaproteobacteria bacterium]|nr:GldG family protein [Deltaproteobacteria bacterium]